MSEAHPCEHEQRSIKTGGILRCDRRAINQYQGAWVCERHAPTHQPPRPRTLRGGLPTLGERNS
jgi:hypothetical protein